MNLNEEKQFIEWISEKENKPKKSQGYKLHEMKSSLPNSDIPMVVTFTVKFDVNNPGDEEPFIDEVLKEINEVGSIYEQFSVTVDSKVNEEGYVPGGGVPEVEESSGVKMFLNRMGQ